MSGASGGNQTTSDDDGSDDFPIAAIVCLAVGGYVVLIIGIIILKQYCTSRGSCQCCNAKSEEDGGCSCNFCAKANDACPCCCKCNLDGCMSKICGKPKKINCIDVLLCNCGGCTERNCNSFKCCGCCPRDIQCSCCSAGLCTDCCDADESEPGTCGCFCLEVKIRSPRGGSTRRSTSAPPVVKGERLRQFNTHSGPGKNSSSVISNGKLSPVRRQKQFGEGDGDSVAGPKLTRSGNGIIDRSNNNNNLRHRSSSHSPKLYSTPRRRQASNESITDLNVMQISSNRTTTSGETIHSRGNKNKTISSQYRSTVDRLEQVDNDLYDSNNSVKIAHVTSHRRKSSKLRKSVRSGQRSQRFPNQRLVTSDTLNISSTSGQFETLKSQSHGRSLPVPSSGGQRPLPAISPANKTR